MQMFEDKVIKHLPVLW